MYTHRSVWNKNVSCLLKCPHFLRCTVLESVPTAAGLTMGQWERDEHYQWHIVGEFEAHQKLPLHVLQGNMWL